MRKRYAETVACGAPFSQATPLGIERDTKKNISKFIQNAQTRVHKITRELVTLAFSLQ